MAAKYVPYFMWTFTVSFILITFLPRSLDDTMFMDGVAYASIARNMAEGAGSFWKPYFADSFWLPYDNEDFFFGHPPLQYGLESVLFRIFGDTSFVENLYDLIILTATIWLITAIWKQFFGENRNTVSYSWLPVLSWYAMQIVWYAMPNHMLDSTMTVFCLASCYFQMRALKTVNRQTLFLMIGGLCIFLGFLSKGPVSLFPLIFSATYLVIFKKSGIQHTIRPTAIVTATFIILMAVTTCYEPARFFLTKYFNGQIISALTHKREAVGNQWIDHFYLVSELGRSIFPHLIISGTILISFRLFKIRYPFSEMEKRVFWTCCITALSAFVPLMVSIKQYHHYMLPAMPFFALTFAAFLQQPVAIMFGYFKKWSIPAIVTGSVLCWIVMFQKLKAIKADIHVENALTIANYAPKSATIGICHDLFQRADLHVNLQRYHHLSLTTRTDTTIFTLADSSCIGSFDDQNHRKLSLNGGYFLVVKKAASEKSPQSEAISHL